jgi:putative membrane protein
LLPKQLAWPEETAMSGDNEQSGLRGALHKMQDMVGGAVGMASASTAGSHAAGPFVENAAMGDMYEVAASEIAMRRSRSDAVRTFAAMMVEHHTTSMHQMRSALASSEVSLNHPELRAPAELDNRRAGLLQHLQDAGQDEFDKMYLDQQKLAHRETVALLKGYAESGDNPQLRSTALGALPMVERHLAMLDRLGLH